MEPTQEIISQLPHTPGVYIYKDSDGNVIYVGKAKDLKRRVSQYFSRDDAVGPKTATLVSQIAHIDTIDTHSEFDALLLESQLIRSYNPKYNVIAKDDKSPIYVSISLDETLPRITCVRKTAVVDMPKRLYFGPFQSARTLRKLLRQIRMIIPYCTQKQRNGKPCFYTHIGLCDPCASVLAGLAESEQKSRLVATYRANIRKIAAIFSGKSLDVLHDLERDMSIFAEEERFEEAAAVKKAIEGMRSLIRTHYDPAQYVQSESFVESVYEQEMEELYRNLLPFYPTLTPIHKIECIDISNTQGTHATGSLVVLRDGRPNTDEYRRFKIRTKDAPNDFAMIAEVVGRRVKHVEWPFPDLLVIDGGKGQVKMAVAAMKEASVAIPVIGLAKRFEEIIIPHEGGFTVLRLPVSSKALHMLERLRDESHRFAITYHRSLRKKAFIPQK